MPARRPLVLLAATVLAAPLVTACSSDGSSGTSGATKAGSVAVKATDTACQVARTELPAGSTTFAISNGGSKVTEVYVYGAQDGKFTKVVSEVENIGPGTSREMQADLPAGTYEVACKPGQTGDGIRTRIVVGGGSGGTSAEAKYDRELELSTDGSKITGLDGAAVKAGERIEVKLENGADGPRTLEVKRPDGSVAGEAENVAPGKDGELVVDFAAKGGWTVVVEGGASDVTATLTVG